MYINMVLLTICGDEAISIKSSCDKANCGEIGLKYIER